MIRHGALADAIDGSAFSHQLTVTDVDVGDRHTFSMSSDEDISWLSLNSETGLLTGSPDDEQVGVYNITFSVEDAAGDASVSNAISLTVQNVNDPVYIDDGQTSMFRSDIENRYQIQITDEDLADTIALLQQVFLPGCHWIGLLVSFLAHQHVLMMAAIILRLLSRIVVVCLIRR